MSAEIVSKRIKPTENTTLAKLTILDQIKLLISRFSNDDAAELKAQTSLSTIALKMEASLERLFKTAASRLEDGKHNSVTLMVSSKYIPYIDNVINERTGMGKFYKFDVIKRDLPIGAEYMFVVRIERKIT